MFFSGGTSVSSSITNSIPQVEKQERSDDSQMLAHIERPRGRFPTASRMLEERSSICPVLSRGNKSGNTGS